MRYAVTGCSGFVGPFLLDEIRRVDASAVILGVDRQPNSAAHLDQFETVDLLDRAGLMGVIERFKPDAVFHLAALSSVADSWLEPQKSFTNNTTVFLNLLEAVRAVSKSIRVLSVGSSEEYGLQDSSAMPLRENIACNPLSPYAVARVAQSLMTRVYSSGFGLEIVSTRSFNHSGPGQRDQFVLSAFAKRFSQMKKSGDRSLRVGNLAVTRDFSDVRDVVGAYVSLIQRGRPGEIYNVCSGKGATLESIVQSLEQIAGFTVSRQVDAALLRPDDPPQIFGSNEKITAHTGWVPTRGLGETLRDLYDHWLRVV